MTTLTFEDMALDTHSAAARAAEAGVELNLQYFVPKTGVPAWFDIWCMPSDAQNTDSAYAFLDYMLRPEVVAKCTDYTGYATGLESERQSVRAWAMVNGASTRDRAYEEYLVPPQLMMTEDAKFKVYWPVK